MGCKVSIQVHPTPGPPGPSTIRNVRKTEGPTAPLVRQNSFDSHVTVYLDE